MCIYLPTERRFPWVPIKAVYILSIYEGFYLLGSAKGVDRAMVASLDF